MVKAGNVAVGRASCMIRERGDRFSFGTNAKRLPEIMLTQRDEIKSDQARSDRGLK